MKIIRTHEPEPSLSRQELDWLYNGKDVCVTREVLDNLLPQLDPTTSATYDFSRALQGPIISMNLRGIRLDLHRRSEVAERMARTLFRLEQQLSQIVLDGCGLGEFLWSSPAQLKTLLYDILHIPPVIYRGRPTTDEKALNKLLAYPIARPIIYHILAMRELQKRMSVLLQPVGDDGRAHTSYNIAGTSTGRLSSSEDIFGEGGNLQNIEEFLRSMYIADRGMKFAKFDAKSGESYIVGAIEWNLFHDGRYLDAVESGDIHTAVARLCWPELPWTGDLKHDKALAEQPHYRHYTRRFMCKKLGHGSNYNGTPPTLALQSHLPVGVVSDFQHTYFSAFPAHRQWHDYVSSELLRSRRLVSMCGRKRSFHGRPGEGETLREAIAYDPQSSLADLVNQTMLRLWRSFPSATLVANDHDALTFTYPEHLESSIVPALWSLLPSPFPLLHGRTMTIPYDCKVGWNRGDFHPTDNPEGLKDYDTKNGDPRTRAPEVSELDRPIRGGHRPL